MERQLPSHTGGGAAAPSARMAAAAPRPRRSQPFLPAPPPPCSVARLLQLLDHPWTPASERGMSRRPLWAALGLACLLAATSIASAAPAAPGARRSLAQAAAAPASPAAATPAAPAPAAEGGACCQQLAAIGFSSNLPVVVLDTAGQPLVTKGLDVPIRMCTCNSGGCGVALAWHGRQAAAGAGLHALASLPSGVKLSSASRWLRAAAHDYHTHGAPLQASRSRTMRVWPLLQSGAQVSRVLLAGSACCTWRQETKQACPLLQPLLRLLHHDRCACVLPLLLQPAPMPPRRASASSCSSWTPRARRAAVPQTATAPARAMA